MHQSQVEVMALQNKWTRHKLVEALFIALYVGTNTKTSPRNWNFKWRSVLYVGIWPIERMICSWWSCRNTIFHLLMLLFRALVQQFVRQEDTKFGRLYADDKMGMHWKDVRTWTLGSEKGSYVHDRATYFPTFSSVVFSLS